MKTHIKTPIRYLLLTLAAYSAFSCLTLSSGSSTGNGAASCESFAFTLSTDEAGRTLSIDLTRKTYEGLYAMTYLIDADASLSLKEQPSGGSVMFSGLDTHASFSLPALESGSHTISVTLSDGRNTLSALHRFEVLSGEREEDEESENSTPKCETLLVTLISTIMLGQDIQFMVTVLPEDCQSPVTWTNSAPEVLEVTHNAEWDEWRVRTLSTGKAELVFSCDEARVRKLVTVTQFKFLN